VQGRYHMLYHRKASWTLQGCSLEEAELSRQKAQMMSFCQCLSLGDACLRACAAVAVGDKGRHRLSQAGCYLHYGSSLWVLNQRSQEGKGVSCLPI
jgi:hypothetical protein